VIVGSILLAFAIDAWWDGRQQRALEAQYLDALQEEMTTNQADIHQILTYHNLRIEAFDRFLAAMPRVLNAVPEDSARTWIPNLVYSATIPLARSVVGSGDSGLVEDPGVRRAISAWMSAADDVDEDSPSLVDAAFNTIRVAIDISPTVIHDWSLSGSSTAALVALRSRPDFVREAYVLRLLHEVNRGKLERLSEKTDSLLAAIRE
jgi:hypothetical protein